MKWLMTGLSLAAMIVARLDAQDERHLKQAFEGKRITLLIEMPASQEGVDIVPGSRRPLDFEKYSGRLKKHGTAIREGERAMITKIRVKDNLIEVQLGGGGYGTFGDVFSSIASNNGADSGAAQQMRISNERTQRAASGSRFNLRFPNGTTPDDLTADAIVEALADYAEFPAVAVAGRRSMREPAVSQPAEVPGSQVERGVRNEEAAQLRKGMLEEDVEAVAGKPIGETTAGPMTTKKYRWREGVLEADYVNGVMVGYRIASGD